MNRTALVFASSLLLSSSLLAEPCKVNVNTATPQQIALLVRTGPVLATRIAEARPLDAARLDAVKGVGEKWLASNGPHVAFSGPTTCDTKLRAPKTEPTAKQ